MRIVPFLVASLLSAGLTAQTTSAAPVIIVQPQINQGCPVGLEARHAQDSGLVAIGRSAHSSALAYSLIFSPSNAQSIVQAKLTLHGLSGPQVMPLHNRPSADATESFNVAPTRGANDRFHSTVYTEKLTGVQWIELNDLTFADGTHWHESTTSSCRVTPNGYMLVAAGK